MRGSLHCGDRSVAFGRDDAFPWSWIRWRGWRLGAERGGGDLDGLEQECGALEVDVVAGQAGGYVCQGLLDGGLVVEALDQEWVVLDDGGDVVGTVVIAHVLVVHGTGSATGSVLVGVVHALVRFRWFAVEVFVGGWHWVPPGGYMLCC